MNSRGHTTKEHDAAYQILAYLQANPDAQDTLEGIVEWWLLHQEIRCQMEEVGQAVAELTKRGLIAARVGSDSRVHYGIERDKREEIESLLRNWTWP